jgi:nucleotide-binding universal stress UspA family protein
MIMGKRLLIAVDDTDASQRAIRYVGHMAGLTRNTQSVLLHAQPAVSSFVKDAAQNDPETLEELNRLESATARASKALLERYQGMLRDMGVTVDRIATVSRPRKAGVAKTILDYGHENRLNAIVAGRRRLSTLKKTFLGSVSADLVEHSTFLPIWIVGSEPPNNRILVPVDGSEAALRAVEHLAHIFQGNPDVRFQFFHVIPRMIESCPIDFGSGIDRLERVGRRGARHCIDNFYAKAIDLLEAAGLSEQQIDIKVSERMINPGKGIVAEINTGDYRTVVIGRRGLNQSFFAGSVSRYLLNKTDHVTLWLVT